LGVATPPLQNGFQKKIIRLHNNTGAKGMIEETNTKGYLLISGSRADLERFGAKLAENKELQKEVGIREITPLPWISNPKIFFRVKGSRELVEGHLPLAGCPPVVVQKPEQIRPGTLGHKPEEQSSKLVASMGYAAQVEVGSSNSEISEVGQAVGNIAGEIARALLEKLAEYKPPVNLDEYGQTDADGKIYRTFKQYSFEPQEGVSVREVPLRVGAWLAKYPKQFPTLLVDKETLIKSSSGRGGPIDAPVPEEAIPEPDAKPKDYLNQFYFERIGLERDAGSKKGDNLDKAYFRQHAEDDADKTGLKYGRARFTVHRRAQGEGTVVVVIDTAPKYNAGKAVDWSSVDAFIDLEPETRPINTPTGYTPPQSLAQPYHGLMVANLIKLVAPQARVMLVRALDDNGLGNTGDILQIINFFARTAPINITYADLATNKLDFATLREDAWIGEGTRILFNLSLVLFETSAPAINAPSLFQTIDDATLKSVLFVCAAGNNSESGIADNPQEPAAYGFFPGYNKDEYEKLSKKRHEDPPSNGPMVYDPYNMVIGVASSSKLARFLYSSFSNASPLAAPSSEIMLDPGLELEIQDVERDKKTGVFVYDKENKHIRAFKKDKNSNKVPDMKDCRYVRWSGTSFSTPLVAGQAALLVGKRLDLEGSTAHPTEVKERIWLTAVHPRWWGRPSEINIPDSL